jgi:EAL and modified HD-GYP domain-containing signal transduction protein
MVIGAFIGRQPIFNNNLEVVGYKLLFHRYEVFKAEFVENDLTTPQILLNTFMEIGTERLVGDGLIFINFTPNFVHEKYPSELLNKRVVLEVKKDDIDKKELPKTLRKLSKNGFQIALDDFDNPDDILPLLNSTDIIKLNVSTLERTRLKKLISTFKSEKVILLAKDIETLDVFDICRKQGFDYFHGFFLTKPNFESGQKVPVSRLATLRLLAKLYNPDIEFHDLDEIIRNDVTLSYRLLRLINSVFYARPKKIESIRQALTLLGIRRVREWVSMLILSKTVEKPHYLVITALERARMCELLTSKTHKMDMGFMVGLFSILDALLDMPLEDIISSLPVSTEISSAILQHKGSMGKVLHCVLAYQHGEWEEALSTGLDPEIVREAFLESLDWATMVSSLM